MADVSFIKNHLICCSFVGSRWRGAHDSPWVLPSVIRSDGMECLTILFVLGNFACRIRQEVTSSIQHLILWRIFLKIHLSKSYLIPVQASLYFRIHCRLYDFVLLIVNVIQKCMHTSAEYWFRSEHILIYFCPVDKNCRKRKLFFLKCLTFY